MNRALSTNRWHYRQDGQTRGPLDTELLVELIANHRLPPDVLIWTEGRPQWTPAREIEEIQGLIPPPHPKGRPSATPPPQPPSENGSPPLPKTDERERHSQPSPTANRRPPTKLGEMPPVLKQRYQTVEGPEFGPAVGPPQATSVHPWRRWFARWLDLYFFAFTVGTVVIVLLRPGAFAEGNEFAAGFVLVGMWVPVEAIFLGLFATTPGKILLNIRVRSLTGKKPEFGPALQRAAHVWSGGLAFGIPLVNLFTMASAYSKLKKEKTTSWDEGRFRVVHGNVGVGRVLLIILISVALISLMAAGSA